MPFLPGYQHCLAAATTQTKFGCNLSMVVCSDGPWTHAASWTKLTNALWAIIRNGRHKVGIAICYGISSGFYSEFHITHTEVTCYSKHGFQIENRHTEIQSNS